MPKKTFTIVNEILSCLYELGKLLPQPFETPYAHVRRIRSIQYKSYYTSVKQLQKRGAVKLTKNEGINQLQLTPKGKLEVLLIKARLKEKMKWDGKWRIIMFDIPEKSKSLRHRFRNLLKENNFHRLQHSVFINPYPLNKAAIDYLKETDLIRYIRIVRVDEMDNDKKLLKKFRL